MKPAVFEGFRQIAYRSAGIALREHKEGLVSARIAKRVRSLGLGGEPEYLEYLRKDASGRELVNFLDAISTNFTSFFRESDHFETLRKELDLRAGQGQRQLRGWCAAAATGEEPYTLAMVLADALAGRIEDWKLLASDISTSALATALVGRYPADRMTGVPADLQAKYFRPEPASEGGDRVTLRVKEELRNRVVFKRLNLAKPPFPLRGQLDFVFCRNVMIYFDLEVRQRLVEEIERLLKPGALFVIAHSETLSGIDSGFDLIRPSVYRKGR